MYCIVLVFVHIFVIQKTSVMKTIRQFFFFGGLLLFFGLSSAHATPVNEDSETQLRQQIYTSMTHASSAWMKNPGSVEVKFVVDPDGQVQVLEVNGGNEGLQQYVKDHLTNLPVGSQYANGHYTVTLSFKVL